VQTVFQPRDSYPLKVLTLRLPEGEDAQPPPPRAASCKREPFRLQLSAAARNLHFGGHRLRSEELLSRELLLELPDMYSQLRGRNDAHWHVTAALPGDPLRPLYRSSAAHAAKLGRRRTRLFMKMERTRLRREQEQEEEQRCQPRLLQAQRAREAREQEREERELGIFDDDGTSAAADSRSEMDDSVGSEPGAEAEAGGEYRSALFSLAPSLPREQQVTRETVAMMDRYHLHLHPSSFLRPGPA